MNELELMQDIGGIKADIRSILAAQTKFEESVDNRFKSHGERVGRAEDELKADVSRLHERLDQYLASRRNGNGWRSKATYFGGGGTFIAIIETLRHFWEH